MKRGILVYNPTAGQRDRRRAMSALIDRQRGRGLELVNAPTSGPGDATEIVRTFLARGLDVVAVCGGDGTVSEAACGLEGSRVPLAILPGGTSNVLAFELGIPTSLLGAEALLHEGVPHALRLAHADGRPFLLWAGVGIDARVMDKMSLAWKRRLGRAGILPTAVAQFLRYEFPSLEVEIDGVRHEATFAVINRMAGGNEKSVGAVAAHERLRHVEVVADGFSPRRFFHGKKLPDNRRQNRHVLRRRVRRRIQRTRQRRAARRNDERWRRHVRDGRRLLRSCV